MSDNLQKINHITTEDITAVFLTKDNYTEYADMLSHFESVNRTMNRKIQHVPIIFRERSSVYDNRDTTVLFLVRNELMGFISFAASALRDTSLDVVLPTAVIHTFAISKKFSKKLCNVFVKLRDVKTAHKQCTSMSCASFVIEYIMDYINKVSDYIGITHVYLYAESNINVRQFYENNHFLPFVADLKVFGLDRDSCYIRTLENAVHRKFGQQTSPKFFRF